MPKPKVGMNGSEAASICEALHLARHPAEFGWYKQVYKSSVMTNRLIDNAQRSVMTSIYFLQESQGRPLWRQLKSDELIIWVKGSPVKINLLDPQTGKLHMTVIGDVLNEKVAQDWKLDDYQHTAPAGVYFNTEILMPDNYSLFICVVSPGFEFDDFMCVDQTTLHEKFPEYKSTIDRFF